MHDMTKAKVADKTSLSPCYTTDGRQNLQWKMDNWALDNKGTRQIPIFHIAHNVMPEVHSMVKKDKIGTRP